jgi:hypothetical protein
MINKERLLCMFFYWQDTDDGDIYESQFPNVEYFRKTLNFCYCSCEVISLLSEEEAEEIVNKLMIKDIIE